MHIRRHPSSIALTLALPVALVFGALDPVSAQQPAPTATLPPATAAPTAAPPTLTVAPPTPTAAPPAPTAALPTPEPTLTVPEAIDRILSGEKPVETLVTLFAWQPALLVVIMALVVAVSVVKPWRERFFRWLDRRTGGQRRDLEEEAQRKEEQEKLEAERRARQFQKQLPVGIARYLDWLQAEYGFTQPLGIATEQVQLSLESVHVPLRVVERGAIESHRQRMRGEKQQELFAEEHRGGYVFELLSEPKLLAARRTPPTRGVSGDDESPPPVTTTRLLLLGDAGSGKTTTLRYAALRLAEAYRRGDAALLASDAAGCISICDGRRCPSLCA